MILSNKIALSLRAFAFKLPCVVVLLFFFCEARSQTIPKTEPAPRDIKVLNEYKDKSGNRVRIIQYLQGQKKVTETIIIPPAFALVKVPIRPDTLNKDSVMIVVDKSDYSLQVYYKKRLVRAYKSVFGPRPQDDKCYEGDRCTPEGWYKIISKVPSSRYDKFMLLNYPNDSAMARFTRMKQNGKIPSKARIGGSVGIHGIWKGGDEMIDMGIGWTDGCIALKNKDVDELYTLVSVGTRVYIKK